MYVHSESVTVYQCMCVQCLCAEEKVTKIETLRKANRESERERRGVSEV